MNNSQIWIALLAVMLLVGLVFYTEVSAPSNNDENTTVTTPVPDTTTPAPTPDDTDPTPDPDTTNPAPDTPSDYIGLTEAEAEALAAANDVMFRVVERDGEMLPTTRDYRPGRINATVDDGMVTRYLVEGELEPVEATTPSDSNKQGDPDANKYDFGDPVTPPEETEEAAGEHDAIIGMSEDDAETYAEANDVTFRVGFRDGEPLALTMDYRPGRITAQIEDGVVTGYTVE